MNRGARGASLRVALIAWLAVAHAQPAHAYLESIVLSARTASLGGAFVAIGDDPSAVVDNSAGLSGIASPSFLSTYDRPYGVDAINEGFLAAVLPFSKVAMGASWFHRGVSDALSEDMVTLAFARDLKRTSEDASLSVGASVDLAHVSTQAEQSDAGTAVTCSASVLLRPFAFIGLGYSIRNITQPSFDLIQGGGETSLTRAQAVGLSYYWQQRLLATIESQQDANGVWKSRGGVEVRIENHVMLRGGLDGTHTAVGVGVLAGGFAVDLAMTSHDTLGATYLFTLRYARPRPAAGY